MDIDGIANEVEWRLVEAQPGQVVAVWADGQVTVHDTRPGTRLTRGEFETPVAEFRRLRRPANRLAIRARLEQAFGPDPHDGSEG